ncbi:MAG TPA: LacI family transcriptional regulator [Firmicutes bacterium]|nr:LacI family transcriptional regulator [Bacillota bacterium]
MSEKVNIRKLAELAGVSVATVSRVLNGKAGVSEKTRRQVIEYMHELNYRPPVILNRGETIGLVVFPNMEIFLTDFFADLLQGLTEETFRRGQQLMLMRLNTGDLTEDIMGHYMRSHGLCGYIILGTTLTTQEAEQLAKVEVPYVVTGGAYLPENINWVGYDHIGAGRDMARYVLSLRHRHIAAVGRTEGRPVGAAHLQGINEELAKNGLELWGGAPVAPHPKECRRLLEESQATGKPTTIIGLSQEDGLLIVSELTKMGLRLPTDISVAAFGDYHSIQWVEPKLTTMRVPTGEIGSKSINLLLDLAAGWSERPVRHQFSPQLVLRDSVGAI